MMNNDEDINYSLSNIQSLENYLKKNKTDEEAKSEIYAALLSLILIEGYSSEQIEAYLKYWFSLKNYSFERDHLSEKQWNGLINAYEDKNQYERMKESLAPQLKRLDQLSTKLKEEKDKK